MHFVVGGGAAPDLYDHQAYVTALCADEILSASDAETIVSSILRSEFGSQGAVWTDPLFMPRIHALAGDVHRAVLERAKAPTAASRAPR